MSILISNAFAQTIAPAVPPDAAPSLLGNLGGMLPLLAMFALLYFVMIRPQMRRQKEMRAMLSALTRGDEVVLSGGLIGRITYLDDSLVTLEIASGVQVKAQRSGVVQVLPKGSVDNKQ